MIVIERKRDKEKEREIIQLHRLCSRSQTICVCKEQKRRKKKETRKKKRRKMRKERRDEHNGKGNR